MEKTIPTLEALYFHEHYLTPQTKTVQKKIIDSINKISIFSNDVNAVCILNNNYVNLLIGNIEPTTILQVYINNLSKTKNMIITNGESLQQIIISNASYLKKINQNLVDMDITRKAKFTEYVNTKNIYEILNHVFNDKGYINTVSEFLIYYDRYKTLSEDLIIYLKLLIDGLKKCNINLGNLSSELNTGIQTKYNLTEPILNKKLGTSLKSIITENEKYITKLSIIGETLSKDIVDFHSTINKYKLNYNIDPYLNKDIKSMTWLDLATHYNVLKRAIEENIKSLEGEKMVYLERKKTAPEFVEMKSESFDVDLKDIYGNSIVRNIKIYKNEGSEFVDCLAKDASEIGKCVTDLNIKDVNKNITNLRKLTNLLGFSDKSEKLGGGGKVDFIKFNAVMLELINKSIQDRNHLNDIAKKENIYKKYTQVADNYIKGMKDEYELLKKHYIKISEYLKQAYGHVATLEKNGIENIDEITDIKRKLSTFAKHMKTELDNYQKNTTVEENPITGGYKITINKEEFNKEFMRKFYDNLIDEFFDYLRDIDLKKIKNENQYKNIIAFYNNNKINYRKKLNIKFKEFIIPDKIEENPDGIDVNVIDVGSNELDYTNIIMEFSKINDITSSFYIVHKLVNENINDTNDNILQYNKIKGLLSHFILLYENRNKIYGNELVKIIQDKLIYPDEDTKEKKEHNKLLNEIITDITTNFGNKLINADLSGDINNIKNFVAIKSLLLDNIKNNTYVYEYFKSEKKEFDLLEIKKIYYIYYMYLYMFIIFPDIRGLYGNKIYNIKRDAKNIISIIDNNDNIINLLTIKYDDDGSETTYEDIKDDPEKMKKYIFARLAEKKAP